MQIQNYKYFLAPRSFSQKYSKSKLYQTNKLACLKKKTKRELNMNGRHLNLFIFDDTPCRTNFKALQDMGRDLTLHLKVN